MGNQKKSGRIGKSTRHTVEIKMEECMGKGCCDDENNSNSTEMTDGVFDGTTSHSPLIDGVFDGTTSHSPFADFIYGADESDEEAERAETEYWAGCQGINS